MFDLHAYPKHNVEEIEFVVTGMPKQDVEEYFRQHKGHITKRFHFIRQKFPHLPASHVGFTKTHVYLLIPHTRCDCSHDLF